MPTLLDDAIFFREKYFGANLSSQSDSFGGSSVTRNFDPFGRLSSVGKGYQAVIPEVPKAWVVRTDEAFK